MEKTTRVFLQKTAPILLILMFPFVTTNIVFAAGQRSDSAGSSAQTTGVIIPLYSYPGADWDSLIQQRHSNPLVPIIAIINPDSGAGQHQDPNYVTGIKRLLAAGMTVLGYTYTDYGRRDVAVVAAEVDRYKSWYSVSGIFFDEMSNAVGGESYYSYLSLHAKAIGLSYIVGNPGTAVPSTYVGTVDVIVTYEASGLPTPATLATSDASSLRRDQMVHTWVFCRRTWDMST
jgi:hypothetical protein